MGSNRNIDKNCICNEGLFGIPAGGMCNLSCNYKCSTCVDGTGTCLTCSDPNRNKGLGCIC